MDNNTTRIQAEADGVSSGEFALITKKSIDTIYRWIHEGKIKAVKYGTYIIPRWVVDDYVEKLKR